MSTKRGCILQIAVYRNCFLIRMTRSVAAHGARGYVNGNWWIALLMKLREARIAGEANCFCL